MAHDSPRGGTAAAQPAGAAGEAGPRHDVARARLAHDINNPLAIVLSNVEYALEELASRPDGGGEMNQALVEARDAVLRIRDLVGAFATSAEDTAASTWAPEPVLEPEPLEPPTARVLVVDDEPMLGRGIARGLREHQVTVVASGAEALALLQAGERYDAILCDLMMPTMPGFDLHEQVSLLVPEQAERMVFMTGGATTTRAREFVESHRGVVLQKPVSMEMVREAFTNLLAAPTPTPTPTQTPTRG